MTTNQIAYQKMLNEQEANAIKAADVQVKSAGLRETQRSNLADELLKYMNIQETSRSNQASERNKKDEILSKIAPFGLALLGSEVSRSTDPNNNSNKTDQNNAFVELIEALRRSVDAWGK